LVGILNLQFDISNLHLCQNRMQKLGEKQWVTGGSLDQLAH
jgi:hypothetical protein